MVQAPGEAEATCGALNAAGLVDGVATVDGDALLFGASVVYKELGLSTSQPKACSLARSGCATGLLPLLPDGAFLRASRDRQRPPHDDSRSGCSAPCGHRCSIEAVRSRLGISSGGGDALIAVAALSGGDYNEACVPFPWQPRPPLVLLRLNAMVCSPCLRSREASQNRDSEELQPPSPLLPVRLAAAGAQRA